MCSKIRRRWQCNVTTSTARDLADPISVTLAALVELDRDNPQRLPVDSIDDVTFDRTLPSRPSSVAACTNLSPSNTTDPTADQRIITPTKTFNTPVKIPASYFIRKGASLSLPTVRLFLLPIPHPTIGLQHTLADAFPWLYLQLHQFIKGAPCDPVCDDLIDCSVSFGPMALPPAAPIYQRCTL